MVEVEEVDGGLRGGRPGLWRLVPSALAPSGRGTGARGPFAWWLVLGLARWEEALAPLWGEVPGVLGASLGPALVSAERDGVGAVGSRVWPSGLSGALLPWSSSFWRCQTTRICGPPLSPRSRGRYWIVP